MARHPSGGGRSPRPGRSGRGRGTGRGGRHYHRKNDTGTARPPPGGVTASVAHQCGGGDTRGGTDAESLLEAVSTLAGQVSCDEPKPRVLCSFVVLNREGGGGPSDPFRIFRISRDGDVVVSDRCPQSLRFSYYSSVHSSQKMPFRLFATTRIAQVDTIVHCLGLASHPPINVKVDIDAKIREGTPNATSSFATSS